MKNIGSIILEDLRPFLFKDIVQPNTRIISKGARASIFWHKSLKTGEEYAVKVSSPPAIGKREAQIINQVAGPNVVRVHESFVHSGKHFTVMDYYTEGTLLDYVNRFKDQLKEEDIRPILFQLVAVISRIHGLGIAHRDVKLDNLLVKTKPSRQNNARQKYVASSSSDRVDTPSVKTSVKHLSSETNRSEKNRSGDRPAPITICVCDFDLSTEWNNLDSQNEFCGSPFYAAPEVFQRTPYRGPEIDMWSIGVIFYCLLFKCFPFFGRNAVEVSYKVRTNAITIPDTISKSARSLLFGLLEPDPRRRMSSSAALIHPWFDSIRGQSVSSPLFSSHPVPIFHNGEQSGSKARSLKGNIDLPCEKRNRTHISNQSLKSKSGYQECPSPSTVYRSTKSSSYISPRKGVACSSSMDVVHNNLKHMNNSISTKKRGHQKKRSSSDNDSSDNYLKHSDSSDRQQKHSDRQRKHHQRKHRRRKHAKLKNQHRSSSDRQKKHRHRKKHSQRKHSKSNLGPNAARRSSSLKDSVPQLNIPTVGMFALGVDCFEVLPEIGELCPNSGRTQIDAASIRESRRRQKARKTFSVPIALD